MRNRIVISTVAAVIALPMLASMAFALSWFSHSSSVKSENVQIIYPVRLADGTTLNPGTYRVEFPLTTQTAELKFYQDGKLVASQPAQMNDTAKKAPSTEVVYNRQGDTRTITSIRPGGTTKDYVISVRAESKTGA